MKQHKIDTGYIERFRRARLDASPSMIFEAMDSILTCGQGYYSAIIVYNDAAERIEVLQTTNCSYLMPDDPRHVILKVDGYQYPDEGLEDEDLFDDHELDELHELDGDRDLYFQFHPFPDIYDRAYDARRFYFIEDYRFYDILDNFEKELENIINERKN